MGVVCQKGWGKVMDYGGFVGNESLKRQLDGMTDADHLPHALLFEGAPGSGRRMLADRIARRAVCSAPVGVSRPCGVCPACRKQDHPDIVRYSSDGGQSLKVEAIRELRQDAQVLPNEAPYRVYILSGAESMTVQAQNALLKTLEEPPSRVIFILTCENRMQLLDTVRSRCLCLTLQPVEWEKARPILKRQLPQIAEEELRQAHELFGGYIGMVINGIGDGTWRQTLELVPLFAEAVIAPHEMELLRLTGRLEKNRELTGSVLNGLQLVIRDALSIRCGADSRLSTAPAQAEKLASRLSGSRLMALADGIVRLQSAQQHNMNNTLFLTWLCAVLRQAVGN